MPEKLMQILVEARKHNKPVLLKTLVPHGLDYEKCLALEDEGLIHIWHRTQDGYAVSLTLKGYKQYAHLAS